MSDKIYYVKFKLEKYANKALSVVCYGEQILKKEGFYICLVEFQKGRLKGRARNAYGIRIPNPYLPSHRPTNLGFLKKENPYRCLSSLPFRFYLNNCGI